MERVFCLLKPKLIITVEQLGDELHPSFPCFDELLDDVPGTNRILNCPVLLIQVTRLKCGGFVHAIRTNHVFCDAKGLHLFMSTAAEMANGRTTPSIPPVWERHLLDAPDPPQVTCAHHEYDQVAQGSTPPFVQVQRSFFFGSNEFSLLRRLLPPHLRNCTTKFELLTSCLWRCRTIAINPDPTEVVRMICVNNTRSKFNPPLPSGYYGNAFVIPAVITTAGMLCRNPLDYAVELVSQAKASATMEYVKSVASLMVINGKRLHFPNVDGIISDTTKWVSQMWITGGVRQCMVGQRVVL